MASNRKRVCERDERNRVTRDPAEALRWLGAEDSDIDEGK
jgi:hypothetical protein